MSAVANRVVIALLLLILMMGAYLQGGTHQLQEDSASVFSPLASGRSIAFELLSNLGFRVQAWTQDPAALPRSSSLLVISQVPEAPEHYVLVGASADEGQSSGETPRYARLYDPVHYREFVEQGGTLMLCADESAWRFLERYFDLDLGVDQLAEELEEEPKGILAKGARALRKGFESVEEDAASLDEPMAAELDEELEGPLEESARALREGVDLAEEDAGRPDENILGLKLPGASDEDRGARLDLFSERLEFEPDGLCAEWPIVVSLEPNPKLQVLASTQTGHWALASMVFGEGHVVLMESDRFLDNDWIVNHDNGLLLVRLAELFALDRNVYFDEYVLGGWIPDSPLDLAFSASARPLTLHLLLLLVLAIWAGSWARWFPRDPAPLAGISAEMRARGLAGMLSRQKRWELLGQMLRLGVLRRLGRRTGMSRDLLAADEKTLQHPGVMRQLLGPFLRQQSEEQKAHVLAMLSPGRLGSRKQLDALSKELAALETGLEGGEHPKKR